MITVFNRKNRILSEAKAYSESILKTADAFSELSLDPASTNYFDDVFSSVINSDLRVSTNYIDYLYSPVIESDLSVSTNYIDDIISSFIESDLNDDFTIADQVIKKAQTFSARIASGIKASSEILSINSSYLNSLKEHSAEIEDRLINMDRCSIIRDQYGTLYYPRHESIGSVSGWINTLIKSFKRTGEKELLYKIKYHLTVKSFLLLRKTIKSIKGLNQCIKQLLIVRIFNLLEGFRKIIRFLFKNLDDVHDLKLFISVSN